MKAFQTRWAEIGFVPIKEKETVQNEFRKLINDHFDQLDIDEFEKNIERFKSKINTFDNSDDKDSKIIQEREKLVNKIKQLETDLHAWDFKSASFYVCMIFFLTFVVKFQHTCSIWLLFIE